MVKSYSKWLVKQLRREHEGRGRSSNIDWLLSTYKGLAIFNHYYKGWNHEQTALWGINKVRMSAGKSPINKLHS